MRRLYELKAHVLTTARRIPAHKGEYVFHVLYLSATFIEGHGHHAIFAGGVAVFVLIGSAIRDRGTH